MSQQEVKLQVPARATFARSVRMLATNLAVVANFAIDDIEDVRMAAEEGFIYAVATKPEVVDVAYTISDGELTMNFSLGSARPEETLSEEALAYVRIILDGVVDDADFSHGLTLTKRARGDQE